MEITAKVIDIKDDVWVLTGSPSGKIIHDHDKDGFPTIHVEDLDLEDIVLRFDCVGSIATMVFGNLEALKKSGFFSEDVLEGLCDYLEEEVIQGEEGCL